MDNEIHRLLDGKVRVYRRKGTSHWHCSAYIRGFNHRSTTKEENLSAALAFASEWYMARYLESKYELRTQLGPLNGTVQPSQVGTDPQPPSQPQSLHPPRRRRSTGPTFEQACVAFLAEYEVMTAGERNERFVKQKGSHVRLHLIPFFGADRPVVDINPGLIQEYRLHRQTSRKRPGSDEVWRPARTTLHTEIVTLRQILKTANRKGWISHLPDMRDPYKASGKVSRRGWFSPDEYKTLYEATRERAKNPKRERFREDGEQLHDFVLFMVNTGLRPDEAARLQCRDVTIIDDEATHERILQIEVRGKRGFGPCKSMPGAVLPFQRVKKRKNLQPTDLVFGKPQRWLFNSILNDLGLKNDREGKPRTAYSLRHTYISMRLLEGADIYNIAKNCRTSVEMIQKHYAAHIAELIDTASINVRKPKAPKAAGDSKTSRRRATDRASKSPPGTGSKSKPRPPARPSAARSRKRDQP